MNQRQVIRNYILENFVLMSASLPNLANAPYRGDPSFLAKEVAEPDAWTLLLCGLVIGTFIASHRLSGI